MNDAAAGTSVDRHEVRDFWPRLLVSPILGALAVNLSVILAVYGREEGMSGVEREALEGLDRCLS